MLKNFLIILRAFSEFLNLENPSIQLKVMAIFMWLLYLRLYALKILNKLSYL